MGNKPKLNNEDNEDYDKTSLSSNNNKKTSHTHGNHSHSHNISRDRDTLFSSPISFSNNETKGFVKPKQKRSSTTMASHSSSIHDDDMLIEDIQLQDFDMPVNDISISNRHSIHGNSNSSGMNIWKNQGKPISMETSKDLLNLVYGDTKENYQDSWKGKRFVFNKNQNISYGLIQEKV